MGNKRKGRKNNRPFGTPQKPTKIRLKSKNKSGSQPDVESTVDPEINSTLLTQESVTPQPQAVEMPPPPVPDPAPYVDLNLTHSPEPVDAVEDG